MGGATNQYNRQRSGASNGGQKSNNGGSCGCNNCATFVLYILVILTLLLCMVNFWLILWRNQELKRTIFSEIKERNNSIDDVKEQLRNEMENHKDVHKQEFADISAVISNKLTIKRNNNKPQSSEELKVSAEKRLREYFTTALNELKTKVAQKEEGYEGFQSSIDDLEAKVTKISKTNQEQSNDLTNIQTEMNGMLTEALHSAALATTFSGSNGSTIDMDAIVRVELRGVQSALNSEVQSRLQLEQKLETIQMALKEAENNRRSDMDELVSQHEEAMRQLEESHQSQWTEVQTRNNQIWKNMEDTRNFDEQQLNHSISSLSQQVINLNTSLPSQVSSLISLGQESNQKMIDELQKELRSDQEKTLGRNSQELLGQVKQIESRLVQRIEDVEKNPILQQDQGEGVVATINKEVKVQEKRLDHFVKTLMQLKGLPKVTQDLKNRLKALETAS